MAVGPVGALDPPGGVVADLDFSLRDEIADLPGRPVAVALDFEVGRHAKVALASRREADVAADPRDAERANVFAHEILSDHVPGAVVLEKGIRIEGPLLLGVA